MVSLKSNWFSLMSTSILTSLNHNDSFFFPLIFDIWKEYLILYIKINKKNTFILGYTIPNGWCLMVVPSAIQLNPNIYEDPLSFDPWRWQVCWKKPLILITLHSPCMTTQSNTAWILVGLPKTIFLVFAEFHSLWSKRVSQRTSQQRTSYLLEQAWGHVQEQISARFLWVSSYMC